PPARSGEARAPAPRAARQPRPRSTCPRRRPLARWSCSAPIPRRVLVPGSPPMGLPKPSRQPSTPGAGEAAGGEQRALCAAPLGGQLLQGPAVAVGVVEARVGARMLSARAERLDLPSLGSPPGGLRARGPALLDHPSQ